MSKTYRFDGDSGGSRRDFKKNKKRFKKQTKFEKRRSDPREFDSRSDPIRA